MGTATLANEKHTVTSDKVKRVIDSSTILLEKYGIVSLDVVRGAGSTYILPECCTYAPAYKLKQLLKRDTQIKVVNLVTTSAGNNASSSSSTARRPRVWIIRSQDELNVDRESAMDLYERVVQQPHEHQTRQRASTTKA
jgi:hypothetical protein